MRFRNKYSIRLAAALLATTLACSNVCAYAAGPGEGLSSSSSGDSDGPGGSDDDDGIELPPLANYSITEVYSMNNQIPNCYYKPFLAEAGLVEENVLKQGFASAYTGYFDTNRTDEYKPEGTSSRALEILGYDFLLDREAYNGGYTYFETNRDSVSYQTAVMDLYKALGIELFDYVFSFSEADVSNSPAVKDMAAVFAGMFDGSRGRTDVFVTRTNPDNYIKKAMTDLKLAEDRVSYSNIITAGDFIVLAMTMMQYYGEPVMSEQEMNLMLQVYGAGVPTYLNAIQREAYLYLRARGIINDDAIDYTNNISLKQMLDMLMCIKDKNSRTTFKDIQVTMDIGDDLIQKGYFPKQVTIADGDEAIQVSTKVDYSKATFYDYYILVDDKTRFVDASGNQVSTVFIPSIPERPESPALNGTDYLGIETGPDNNEYYHLRAPIMGDGSEYITTTNGWIQVNTYSDSDRPYYLWVEQGGGIYSNPVSDGRGGFQLSRRPFSGDKMFESSISEEKVNGTLEESESLVASNKSDQDEEDDDETDEEDTNDEDDESTDDVEFDDDEEEDSDVQGVSVTRVKYGQDSSMYSNPTYEDKTTNSDYLRYEGYSEASSDIDEASGRSFRLVYNSGVAQAFKTSYPINANDGSIKVNGVSYGAYEAYVNVMTSEEKQNCCLMYKDTENKTSASLVDKLKTLALGIRSALGFELMEVYAAPLASSAGINEEVTLFNASNIQMDTIDSFPGATKRDGEFVDSIIVTVPYGKSSALLAAVKRDATKTQNHVYDGIATLSGDLLINYIDLEDRGLVYTSNGKLPQPDSNGLLTLNSKYGRVILDNDNHMIVSGNSVYKLNKDTTVLYQYKTDPDTGTAELYVDFRAVYGWTANISDITITGNGSTYSVNVTTQSSTRATVNMMEGVMGRPNSFNDSSYRQNIGYVPGNVIDDSDTPKVLASYNYSLANYVIYYGVDKNGIEQDYVFVYYPKKANVAGEDGTDTISKVVGSITTTDDWICRAYPLSMKETSEVGKFTYSERYGYLYNTPKESEFTMDKYLSGEYILPLAVKSGNRTFYDYNVNAYGDLPYGTRPYEDKHSGEMFAVDIKGNKTAVTATTDLTITTAPVGVAMFFGGASACAPVNDAAKSGFIGKAKGIFYGSNYCKVDYDSTANVVKVTTKFTGKDPWSHEWELDSNNKVYQVNAVPTKSGQIDATYVYYGSALSKKDATEEESTEEEATIVGEGRDDEHADYKDFSLDNLIKQIDDGTSWGILFCFMILPLVGIILLTLLVGFAFIADSQFFRNIFKSTIDPIKFLTLGKKDCETFSMRQSLVSIIFGYISLSMILDGNMLRLIQYCATWIEVFLQLLRQL